MDLAEYETDDPIEVSTPDTPVQSSASSPTPGSRLLEATDSNDVYSGRYQVALNRLPRLRENLKKLNKRAGKLGAEPFTMTLGRRGEEFLEDRSEGRAALIQWIEVTLTGRYVALGDYRIKAVMNHRDEVYSAVGSFRIPSRYINCAPDCDHCKLKRERATTYLLADREGNLAHVGRSCLEDFTGHSPEHALSATSIFEEFRAQMDQSDPDDGPSATVRYEAALPILPFLAVIARRIRTAGWVSGSTARSNAELGIEPSVSTAGAAMDELKRFRLSPDRLTLDAVEVDDEDRALATAAIAYAREKYAALDDQPYIEAFDATMRALVRSELFITRLAGMAAYTARMYISEVVEPPLRARREANSDYVGVEKERREFTVRVERLIPVSGYMAGSTTMIHILSDENGNQLKWANNGGASSDLVAGHAYVVKATVKKHEAYNNVRQTHLTRVAVVQELDALPAPQVTEQAAGNAAANGDTLKAEALDDRAPAP